MKLNIMGEALPCARAEKNESAGTVTAYADNGSVIFRATNVTDFSDYVPENGEWSEPEISDTQRIDELEALVAAMLYGGEAV